MNSRVRRYALLLCAILSLGPLFWIGIVLVAPTGWAKRHLVAALAAHTGRVVRLEGLSVGLLGGIRLTNLEIGSPRSIDDPWLKSADVSLDMSWGQLLQGKLEPRNFEVSGAQLRVLRRRDGTVELADFLAPKDPQRQPDGVHRRPGPVVVQLRNCTVSLIDEASETHFALLDVEGEAIRTLDHTNVERMRGTMNGGLFHFSGQFERTGPTPRFEGRFRADDVALDDGMSALRYVVPVLAGAPLDLISGRLRATLYLQGEGATWPTVRQSLAGQGTVALDPIDLDGAPVLAELSKVAELTRRGHAASIHSDFVIGDQRIATDHFTLDIGRVPFKLAGWTDFDGRLDYRINLSGLNDRLPEKARRILGDLNVNFQSLDLLTLQGSVNKLAVHLNGVALDRNLFRESGIKREDREKLRAIGRKFLDELVR
jgi:AsmA protein